jgi:hypothetical protein
MKVTKKQLLEMIQQERKKILNENEEEDHGMGGEDPPTPGDIKFSGRYDQAFDDDDTPMMPPKPVEPKGIAGTDVPVAALSDGFEAAREAIASMYSPTDRRYDNAMMVVDMAEKQSQQKAQNKEPMSSKERLAYMWDFDERSHPSDVKPPNPFREQLEEVIMEELGSVMEEGFGERWKQYKKGRKKQTRSADDIAAANFLRAAKARGMAEPEEEVSTDPEHARRFSSARNKDRFEEELAVVAAEGIGAGEPEAFELPELVQRAVSELQTIRDMLMRGDELPKPNLVAGKILNAIGNIKSHFGMLSEGELEEGMFGLTTDASCKTELDKQNNMWMTRVSSLYSAFKAAAGQSQAAAALDNAGMSAGDLRPAEHSRLEEDEIEESWGEPLRKPDLNKPLRKPDLNKPLKSRSGAGGSGKDRPEHEEARRRRRLHQYGYEE